MRMRACRVLACMFLLAAAPLRAETPDVDALVKMWRSQDAEIATARIRYKHCNIAFLEPLTGVQFLQRLQAFDPVKRPGDLDDFIASIWRAPNKMARPWKIKEIFIQGQRVKEEV